MAASMVDTYVRTVVRSDPSFGVRPGAGRVESLRAGLDGGPTIPWTERALFCRALGYPL